MPPPPPPAGGLGPASPLVGMLSDLPTDLTPGWQAIDMAIRCLRTAMRSSDMQKIEKVVAVIQSVHNTLNKLLTAYTNPGSSSGNAAPEASLSSPELGDSSPGSHDADAQPASGGSSSDESAGE